MDFAKLSLTAAFPILLASCGCSDSGNFVDYASLDAAEPDFVANGTTDFSGGSVEVPSKVSASSTTTETPPLNGDANAEPNQPQATDDQSSTKTVETAAGNATNQDTPAKKVDSQSTTDEVGAADKGEKENSPTVDPLNSDAAKSTEPREIKLLIKDKRFRSEDENLRVSYDDIDLLKVLNMEPVPVDAPKHFPEWLKQLDGKRIRIRGFMYPTFEASGLKGFTLARDNGICCFVRQPMIYDIIGVDMAEGITTDYIDNKPFDVEGVFQIVPEADDTELFQLYRIADAKVLN